MQFLLSLVQRRFWLLAYIAFVLGFIVPPGSTELWQASIPLWLGGILYFTGLRISLTSVHTFFTRGRPLRLVLFLVVLHLLVVPLSVLAVMAVIAPHWAAALFLVALMPPGLSSVAFTDMYRGHVLLALIVVLVAGVLCPFTVPLLLAWPGNAGGALPGLVELLYQSGYLILLLGTPFLLAQLTRQFFPRIVNKYHHRWGSGAILSSCILIFAAVVSMSDEWIKQGWLDLLEPFLWSCLICLIMWPLGLLVHLVLDPARAMAYNMGNVFLNNGLAVAFAAQFFADDPKMALPAVLIQIPMTGGTAAYGAWAYRQRLKHLYKAANVSAGGSGPS